MSENNGEQLFKVTLYRTNGRYVKHATRNSKYAAKSLKRSWNELYDSGYYVEVERVR